MHRGARQGRPNPNHFVDQVKKDSWKILWSGTIIKSMICHHLLILCRFCNLKGLAPDELSLGTCPSPAVAHVYPGRIVSNGW